MSSFSMQIYLDVPNCDTSLKRSPEVEFHIEAMCFENRNIGIMAMD